MTKNKTLQESYKTTEKALAFAKEVQHDLTRLIVQVDHWEKRLFELKNEIK